LDATPEHKPVPFSAFFADAPPPQRHDLPRGAWLLLVPPINLPPRAGVLFVHGGNWTGGSAADFLPHARYFASRGVLCGSVDYRLLRSGLTLDDQLADCAAAVRLLRRQLVSYGAPLPQVAMIGDSAGGHLAACVATLRPREDRPDLLILCNPVVDLTDGDWHHPAGEQYWRTDATAKPPPITADRIRLAMNASPLFNVPHDAPPMLILHGTADAVVSSKQSRRFHIAAARAGVASELQLLEGRRHAFVCARWKSPESVVVDAVRRIDVYLRQHAYLSGEPTLTASDPPAWLPVE
jgi:acetyl esterase/lipase